MLGDRPNQIERRRPESIAAEDLLNFAPEAPITEAGLRNNIAVGIRYLGSWLAGNGCVAIFNLMEDAATAEIARAQVWQWVKSPKGVLDDGRNVDRALVLVLIEEELQKVVGQPGSDQGSVELHIRAARAFSDMSLAAVLPDFLTLPLYEHLP